jgi:hypothetical protein
MAAWHLNLLILRALRSNLSRAGDAPFKRRSHRRAALRGENPRS